jgi:hypothetical protein
MSKRGGGAWQRPRLDAMPGRKSSKKLADQKQKLILDGGL